MLYRVLNNILNAGNQQSHDFETRLLIHKLNAFCFGVIAYLSIMAIVNFSYANYDIAWKGTIEMSLLVLCHLIYRITKKVTVYQKILVLGFTCATIEILITGAYKGSGIIATAIMILLIMNISDLKSGSIFCITILLTEIFVACFNTKLNFIMTYPPIINEFFVRFILAHIGIFVFCFISKNKQEEQTAYALNQKKEKEELFINIVHDIKTPLTIIHNAMENWSESDDIHKRRQIQEKILKMEKNILNILNSHRLEKGIRIKRNAEVLNLSQKTEEIVELYREHAANKDISLLKSIEPDIFCKIDETDYSEILGNVLDNAIKYNKKNGTVLLSLTVNSDEIKLFVQDTGIGVSLEDKENIFSNYFQSSDVNKEAGFGIGLYIVKKICNLYAGNIELLNTSRHGSEFCITLHRTEQESCGQLPLRKVGQNSILVVEDNKDLRDLLVACLKDSYTIYTAANGKEAIDALHAYKTIDLIITDYKMPHMDGLELMRQLKNQNPNFHTPIIFLTASADRKVKETVLSLGAIDLIEKPFNSKELLFKIDAVISIMNNKNSQLIDDIGLRLKDFLTTDKTSQASEQKSDLDKHAIVKFSISNREESVIRQIYAGHTYKEIAYELNISLSTVKTHLQRIYKKCDLNSSTELLKLFYQL